MRTAAKALLPLFLFMAGSAVVATSDAQGQTPSGPQSAASSKNAPVEHPPVPDALKKYLGTWLYVETREKQAGGTAEMEHFMLIKWEKGTLKVKTVDYLPEKRIWGRTSNWQGKIRVDQWNTAQQNFSPRDDGTVHVSFSGTNGFGQATTAVWWAVGSLVWKKDAEGELLHLETTRGYSPSSKGNAWAPMDYRYRRVSTEVDRNIELKKRR